MTTELEATWTTAPGRIADLAATRSQLFVVELASEAVTVRPGRWTGAAWRWESPWATSVTSTPDDGAWPSQLAVREHHDSVEVAVNLEEFQGGSYGIALARFSARGWSEAKRIPNPTDESDIRFGTPLVLGEDELFTVDIYPTFWHYHTGTEWKGVHLPSPGSVEGPWWNAALSRDGNTLLVDYVVERSVRIAEYRRVSASAPFQLQQTTLPVGTEITAAGLAFTGSHLLVAEEVPDGLAVHEYDRDAFGAWQQVDTRTLPLLDSARWTFATRLVATADWVFAAGWIYHPRSGSPVYRVRVPPRADGRPTRAQATFMGGALVIAAGDQLGWLDLAGLR